MEQGFNEVPMHQSSIEKTAFVTREVQYEFLRVPFDLANSPLTFQRNVNLGNLRHDQVLAYMNDLLITSAKVREDIELLEVVLKIIKSELKLKMAKCAFL